MAKKEKTKKVKQQSNVKKFKMNKFNKFWGIWNFVEAALLLTAGILCTVFAVMNENISASELPSYIAYLVGGFIILDGGLRIITSLVKGEQSTESSIMLIGGFEITFGIVLMLFNEIFISFIVKFIAIFLIVVGALFIAFSVFAIVKRKVKMFVPIMEVLFGAVLSGVGIAILVLFIKDENSNTSMKIGLICVGCVLLIAGLVQALITAILLSKAKKEEKAADEVKLVNYQGEAVEQIEQKPRNSQSKNEIIEIDEN